MNSEVCLDMRLYKVIYSMAIDDADSTRQEECKLCSRCYSKLAQRKHTQAGRIVDL